MTEKKGHLIRRILAGLVWTAVLLAVDRLTKQYAQDVLRPEGPLVLIPGILQFQYLENRGAAFGILQNRQALFSAAAMIASAGSFYFYAKSPEGKRFLPFRISMIGICSGALGNMIDRLSRGYVTDFIYFSGIDFPIFNVADICVSLSVILLLILVLFVYREEDYVFVHGKKRDG